MSEKCGVHEEQIASLTRRMDGMDWVQISITKTNTIMEMLLEDRQNDKAILQKQADVLGQLSSAMVQVNDNLSVLNNEIKDIRQQMDDLENKVEQSEEKNKVDIRDYAKKGLDKLITAGAGGGIVWLLTQLGDKVPK